MVTKENDYSYMQFFIVKYIIIVLITNSQLHYFKLGLAVTKEEYL